MEAIAELKGWYYDLTDVKFGYKYEETTKKVGEYVGRADSKEMKQLVVSSKETIITKPAYPTGDEVTEEKKVIWGKEYDPYIKRNTKYDQDKAKTYEVVWGRCTKAMKNRIEKLGSYESIEENYSVSY